MRQKRPCVEESAILGVVAAVLGDVVTVRFDEDGDEGGVEDNDLSWLYLGAFSKKWNPSEENPISERSSGTVGHVPISFKKLKLLEAEAVSWLNFEKSGFPPKPSKRSIGFPHTLTPKFSFGVFSLRWLENGSRTAI